MLALYWSRYNVLFERDGVHLLYNSLSNSFAEISERVFKTLSGLSPGENCGGIEDSLLSNLTRMKAVVPSDDVEMLKDRYIRCTRRFNDKTLSITINPTLACNFACPYCFEGEHPRTFMTDEVEDALVKYVQGFKNANRLSISWFGGEPLLYFERILSLSNKLMGLGLEYNAAIVTNGFLLCPKIADQLAEIKISNIQITLDGIGQKHDSRRFLIGGGSTYETIVKNIQYIAENRPELTVSIRVNIDKENHETFYEVYKEFEGKYANVHVHPAFVKDVSGKGDCQSVMTKNDIFKYLVELYNTTGLDFNNFYPVSSKKECAVRNSTSFVVGPEGELYKCWNDVGKSELVYGNILTPNKLSNETVVYQYLMDADQYDDPTCQACVLMPNCGGGCPHTRLLDKHREQKLACPIEVSDIADYLWAHYCIKNGKHITL